MRLACFYWLVICTVPVRGFHDQIVSSPKLTSSFNPAIVNRNQQFRHLQTTKSDLCGDPRCTCLPHSPVGLNITCHCSPQDQEATLAVQQSSVPKEVALLTIVGCRDVLFHDAALKQRTILANVTITDVGRVVFQAGSVSQAQADLHPVITVGRCRELVLQNGALSSQQRPVSFTATHCHSVVIEESAFSRIQRILLSSIARLDLASFAFRLSGPAVAETAEIGADVTIQHSFLPDIKSFTFPSPLNRLLLNNVTVEDIHPNGTSALRILHLKINSSTIGVIGESAFSEFTHLDTMEMINTNIQLISSHAMRSASSYFGMIDCHVARMTEDALNMPVARVVLRGNRIDTLGTGSLHLREWNDLLVENNTMKLVEKHAFYNIGEPKKILQSDGKTELDVRFVIRRNNVVRADVGAFIFSAQASKLQLEDNYFHHTCDCNLHSWTADLTQVNRRMETTPNSISGVHNDYASEALWLGPSFLNSSFCPTSSVEAGCFGIEEGFIYMHNYTSQFCPRPREMLDCLEMASKGGVIYHEYESPFDVDLNNGSMIKPIGRSPEENRDLIIIFAVVAAVTLAIVMGLLYLKKCKRRHNGSSKGEGNCEERITCSPLLPTGEKHMGSGVVSSGSISRLSIKEYRNYLEELGPIYSEPSEPITANGGQSTRDCLHNISSDIPPAIPAIPPQWTIKNSDTSKRTIDRGTQTVESPDLKLSLAKEFTEDIMAALKDKLDISPTYCEVRDSIVKPPNQANTAANTSVSNDKGIYDVIRVVDSKPRPSTSTTSDPVYCKPWSFPSTVASTLSNPTPVIAESSPKQENADSGAILEKIAEQQSEQNVTKSDHVPKTVESKEEAPLKTVTASGKQPFYIRGSLPKWPPPAKDSKTTNGAVRNRPPTGNVANATSKYLSTSPAGPLSPNGPKDTKPPWRNTATARTNYKPRHLNDNTAKTGSVTKTDHSKASNTSKVGPTVAPSSPDANSILSEPKLVSHFTSPKGEDVAASVPLTNSPSESIIADKPNLENSENTDKKEEEKATDEYIPPRDQTHDVYSEVVAQPFSFSFRRPLFNRERPSKTPPPKPARAKSPTMCDYADPRDTAEHLYAELPSNQQLS